VSALRSVRFGLLITYLRDEEKLILNRARARSLDVTTLLERQLVLDLNAPTGAAAGFAFDCVVDRCVAHLPANYTLKTFERWGIPTINSAETTAICDDKARCSLALEAFGVPTPKTMMSFSVESALEACDRLGYPCVLKPVTGSWGRLLAKVNGPEQAKIMLEQKRELGSIHHAIFYVQEYIEKPGRDIRAFVVGDRVIAASYRTSDHWITNTARGGHSVSCPVTPEIEDMALRACRAVGARWAGVDLMETDRGLVCIEVNSGGEFHGLMTTTDVDIADEIVLEALAAAAQIPSMALKDVETVNA
jgi:[lysine-biosynthesis-protein LysW]--L-2-aminoadipate ligase